MTSERLSQVGKLAVLGAIGSLILFLLWPVEAQKLDPNKKTIWAYRDGTGRVVICGVAEPDDAQLEHARALMAAGYSYDEVHKYLDQELQDAPPKCLKLFGPIEAGDFPIQGSSAGQPAAPGQ